MADLLASHWGSPLQNIPVQLEGTLYLSHAFGGTEIAWQRTSVNNSAFAAQMLPPRPYRTGQLHEQSELVSLETAKRLASGKMFTADYSCSAVSDPPTLPPSAP